MIIIVHCTVITTLYWPRAEHGMEWNGKWNGTEILVQNVEDARMEWKNGMEDNLPYFHTNCTLDFVHGINRKIYTDVAQ